MRAWFGPLLFVLSACQSQPPRTAPEAAERQPEAEQATPLDLDADSAVSPPVSPPEDAVSGASPALVSFASPEGIARLSRAESKVDFFLLSNHFESQDNLGMCGPTSSVIVLNALRAHDTNLDKHRDQSLFPAEYRAGLPPGLEPVFNRYSQQELVEDPRFSGVKSKDRFYGKADENGLRDPGLQLDQLRQVLENFGLEATTRFVDESLPVAQIREELTRNLRRPEDFVIVNYHRQTLGQEGGGHLSPLGAYDRESDSFLILDVNPNRQPWVWVATTTLVRSMATRDTSANRGYLLVREGSASAQ